MKKERGITLIALVITIIVLMILAGVTVSLIAGDESVYNSAREASNKYNIKASEEEEKVNEAIERLAIVNNEIEQDDLANRTPGTATAEDILEGKTAWVNGQLIEGTRVGKLSFVESKTLYSGTRVASGSKTFTLNKGTYYVIAINTYTGSSSPYIAYLNPPTLTIDNGTIEEISTELITNARIEVYEDGAIVTVNYPGADKSTAFGHRVDVLIYNETL